MPAPASIRILLVRTGAMGDILHALPAVAALRAALPAVYLGWAVEPHWQPLLDAAGSSRGPLMPLLDRVHPVPTRAWKRRPFSRETARELLELRGELRGAGYQLAVDLQGSIRSAAIARLAGAPVTGSAEPREQVARLLYGRRIQLRQRSVLDQAAELLNAATGVALKPVPPPLPLDPGAEAWCDRQLLPQRFALLHPDAGWPAKRWPAAHYAELTRMLLSAGCPVLVSSGAAVQAPPEITAAGAQPVRCSVAELIALTRRAALVVGGDSGPVHLAAALRRPTIALFGPTDPARNGPHFPGAPLTILGGGEGPYSLKRSLEAHAGLARIRAGEVLGAAAPWLAAPVPA